jgi:hypothetical protein
MCDARSDASGNTPTRAPEPGVCSTRYQQSPFREHLLKAARPTDRKITRSGCLLPHHELFRNGSVIAGDRRIQTRSRDTNRGDSGEKLTNGGTRREFSSCGSLVRNRWSVESTHARRTSANGYHLSTAVRNDSAQTLVILHNRLSHRGGRTAHSTIRLDGMFPSFTQQERFHPQWGRLHEQAKTEHCIPNGWKPSLCP